MSVLSTFYFKFASDASALKTGLKDAENSSKDLGKNLNSVDEVASKLGSNFDELAKKVGKALGALFAADQLKKLVQVTNEHTWEIRQQASALGMSVEKLSAWQQAVQLSGGTAAGATQTLTGLHDKLVEMSRFGGAMGPDVIGLEKLGLSVKDLHEGIRDPTAVLGKLADTFAKLDKVGQLSLGKNLGLDLGTITLLSQGRKAVDELIAKQKELGVVTEKQAELSAKFKLKTLELGLTFEASARELVTSLLPALTWFEDKIETVVGFLREHKVFAEAFFAGVAGVITLAYLPAITAAAVETLIAIAPFALLAAGAVALGAAIALVVDDIMTFIEGGQSLIGDAINKWPILGEIFKAIKEIIMMSIDAIKIGFNLLVEKMAWMKPLWTDAVDAMAKPWKWLEESIQKVWDLIKNAPVAGINWIGKKLAQLTGGHFDEIGGNPAEAVKKGESASTKYSSDTTGTGKEIAAKLEKMGWSPDQAAGMAGSILQESSGNAGAKNASGHYGIAQWGKDRQEDFKKWSGHDIKGSSLDEQLAFMNWELTAGNEKKAGGAIRNANTASGAAIAHSKYYERPGTEEANNERRAGLAESIASGQEKISAIPKLPANYGNTNNTATSATTVTTGPITVNTQATDGEEVSKAIGNHLGQHIKNATDHFDDGVSA